MDTNSPIAGLALVVAAGGSSTRYSANKLFEDLGGMPVFLHCLRRLAPLAQETCLVVPEADKPRFEQTLAAAGLEGIRLVYGGPNRQSSVLAGLRALSETIRVVAVQDAARPLTSPDLLALCVKSALECGSGVAAHQVTDTIKVVNAENRVVASPERSTLCAAETPQCFRIDWLRKGYEMCLKKHLLVTDDAAAVQEAGYPVHLIVHREPNLKITTPADLMAARVLATAAPHAHNA